MVRSKPPMSQDGFALSHTFELDVAALVRPRLS